MAPPRRVKSTKRNTSNKPSLTLASESPGRPLSAFGGFQAQTSAQPWSSRTVTIDAKGKAKDNDDTHRRLWADVYRPSNLTQVAVHKKKAEAVAGWLRDALDGKPMVRKYRRILCLSGPSGAGKSALIHALSSKEDLDYDIVEWTDEPRQMIANSSAWDRGSSGFGDADHSELHSRFSSFLSQSSHFASLIFSRDEDRGTTSRGTPAPQRRRIVLIDDMPNLQYEPTKRAFQSSLMQFINEFAVDAAPLVLVLSETTPRFDDWEPSSKHLSWKERGEEMINVRSILPDAVRNHPAFTNIKFNPIAATLLRKTLTDMIAKERKIDSSNVPAPSSSEAKECVEAVIAVSNGDIRSSLHALQMLLQSNKRILGKRMANGSSKHASASSLNPFGRESSLVIFHALGRILYNKRVGDPGDDESNEQRSDPTISLTDAIDAASVREYELPGHLQHRARRKSRVDVETLWRTIPIDANTLQLYLHQNYPQFCDDVDQCCELIEHLSNAETLKTTHEEWLHAVVSDHYAFQITTRGTLLALPSPVSRSNGQKMQGAAYFEHRRRLLDIHQTLGGLAATQIAMQTQTVDELDRPFVRSTVAECSLDTLAAEVLPIVARSRTLPHELRDCLLWKDSPAHSQAIEMDDDDLSHLPSDAADDVSMSFTRPLQPLFEMAKDSDLLVTDTLDASGVSEESEIEDADV